MVESRDSDRIVVDAEVVGKVIDTCSWKFETFSKGIVTSRPIRAVEAIFAEGERIFVLTSRGKQGIDTFDLNRMQWL